MSVTIEACTPVRQTSDQPDRLTHHRDEASQQAAMSATAPWWSKLPRRVNSIPDGRVTVSPAATSPTPGEATERPIAQAGRTSKADTSMIPTSFMDATVTMAISTSRR